MKSEKDFMPEKSLDSERVPSLWLRFAANTLDSVILLFLSLPLIIPMVFVVFRQTIDALESGAQQVSYTHNQQLVIGFTSLALLLFTVAYYTFTTSSRLQGTLGKAILKLKVVDSDGNKINRSTSFRRYMFLAGPGMPYSLLGSSQNMIASGIGVFFSIVQTVYLIISALQAQNDPHKRMIHDRFAKTKVVYKTHAQ